MNEQELKRKLAEWAGFKLVTGVPVPYYQNPNRQAITTSNDMPNFTQSLDACFKWLVPKARSKCGVTKIDFCYVGDEVGCRLSGGYGALLELSMALAKTEASALCLAIEKLIDGEKKNEHI